MANLSRQLVSPCPASIGGTAAGVLLFGLVALPASVLALVAIYALLAAPDQLAAGLDWLTRVLPGEVALFLTTRVEPSSTTAGAASSAFGAAAIGSLVIALVGAHAGLVAITGALDRKNDAADPRHFVRRHGLAMLLTLAGIMLTVGGLVAAAVLPRIADALAWPAQAWEVLFLLRWPLALVVVTAYLTVLYRLAPNRPSVSQRGALLGALAGAGLWVAASAVLSVWAAGTGDYTGLYGSVGGGLVIVLWFHLSALAVLVGGLVTAETR